MPAQEAMKYKTRRFKDLPVALKEIEPFIRMGWHLESGKPFENFGDMRSREILANWLVCVVVNEMTIGNLTICSDPIGGDGIICDLMTGETWPTEHVMVSSHQRGEAKDLILEAIEKKRRKGGAAYAAGKTLVVLLNTSSGMWSPNEVARALPNPLHFASVWVVGLEGVIDGDYVYAVTNLDLSQGSVPTFQVRINKDFSSWKVTTLQGF
jgi:hypothetical protein